MNAIAQTPDGYLWLVRFKHGRFFAFDVKGGLPVRAVGALLEDGAGRLWLASDQGLLRVRRARAVPADFSRRLIDFQEAERKRMAKELHDGLGQELILIKNRAQLGLLRLDPPAPVAEQLREISTAASAALDDVRTTARALHPYELDRLGLAQALESMVQRAGDSSATRFLIDLDPVDGLLPSEAEIHLYRILQEGLSNVLKHARAREAILEVKREPDRIRASLCDDGCGFGPAPSGATGPGGFGLPGRTERASLIGGRLEVRSAPGRGTRLEVTIPLGRGRWSER